MHSQQNKELSNTGEELASCGLAQSPLEAGGRRVPARAGKGQTQPRRRHPLPNCKQASSFWPKTSWDSGWLTSAGRVAARDQLPRRDTRLTGPGAPRNWGGDGEGEVALHLKRVRSSSSWFPELLRREGTKRRPNRVCAFVEYPRTWTWTWAA